MKNEQANEAEQQSQADAMARLRELIDQARNGNRTVLPLLRKCLDQSPELWRQTGNVGLQAQMALINAICGRDLHLRECIVRQINRMKKDFRDKSSSPLEDLAIERIVTAFLQVGRAETLTAQKPEDSLPWAKFAMEQQDRASRQLTVAMNTLASLRKLSRPIKVEIHQTPAVAPTMPIMAAPIADGEAEGIAVQTAQDAKASVNGKKNHVNGVNRISRINGHNRVAGVLDMVDAGHDQ